MAALHPQFVHFAVALLCVGVLLRVVSLVGWPAFANLAALTLLGLGTGAVLLAVESGTDAHGPVERVPGSRAAVVEHEQWAERTHDIFLGVIVLEGVALALWRSPRRRYALAASALVGLVGLYSLYQTGDRGGRLVYSYAGGVGIRTGDPADVERLLLAGLYHQAMVDRKAGRSAEAAALLAQAAERHPGDPEVQLAAAESQLLDRKDPASALASLKSIAPPTENRSLRIRHGLLTADALEASGQRDGAAAVFQGLLSEYPGVARLQQRLDELKR